MRDEAAVRTQYRTLLRRLRAYATVDGYRNDQLSGQVLWYQENARLLKVVFTKVCSRISELCVGLLIGEPGNRARGLLLSVVRRRLYAGRRSLAEGKVCYLAVASHLQYPQFSLILSRLVLDRLTLFKPQWFFCWRSAYTRPLRPAGPV